MQAQLVSGYNDLLPRFSSLLEQAGRRSFFASRAWFDALSATTLSPSERLFIVGLEDGSAHETRPAAALICRVGASSGVRRGGLPARLASLTGPYTTLFSPTLDPENALAGDAARRLARAVGEARPRPAIQELDCLEHESPEFAGLLEGYRSAGLVVVPYRHFANWYEPIEASFDHYLAQRPSVLRNTLRRKSRRLNELGRVELALTRDGDQLESALADYESIYAASWKQPEPAEGFAAALVRAAAPAGALRLGILQARRPPDRRPNLDRQRRHRNHIQIGPCGSRQGTVAGVDPARLHGAPGDRGRPGEGDRFRPRR